MPFIEITDPGWTELLEKKTHDVYHLQEYIKLEAVRLHGRPLAWIHRTPEDHCLIPLIERLLPFGFKDLSSPYGYPGLLSERPLESKEAGVILQNFYNEAMEVNYVSSFLRLNPYMNNWKLLEIPGEQVFCGHTISIILAEPENGLFHFDFRENHQRNIARLKQEGFTSRINDFSCLDDFVKAYISTMNRNKATAFYYVGMEYFSELCSLLGDHLVFITVFFPDGSFAAGGIYSIFSGVMQYLYGGTTDKAVRYSPSKLMTEAAILEGKQRGAYILHLGGSTGSNDNDGLYHFKKGFSKTHLVTEYSCIHLVHNPVAYDSLPRLSDHYFPAYRAGS